jgi:hypothetical protein
MIRPEATAVYGPNGILIGYHEGYSNGRDPEDSGPRPPNPGGPLSERDRIVQTLEEARFQHFHLKALVITCLTFFSDSYGLFLPTYALNPPVLIA